MKNSVIKRFIIFQLLLFVVCLLPSFCCETSILYAFVYYAYQLLGVFIPGLAIASFINIKHKDEINIYLWSYICGLFINLIEYVTLSSLKLSNYSIILVIVILIISLCILKKNKKTIDSIKINIDLLYVLIICSLLLIMCFICITCLYPLPSYNGGTNYNKDFLFWIGNSISFIKGLPVQTFSLVGEKLYYHYFSSIIIAHACLSTYIDPYTICFNYSYIIPCILLVFSSYSLLNKIIKNKFLIYLGIILALMTEGASTFLTSHLYFCSFGFDYAYSFAIVSMGVLIDICEDNTVSFENAIISCVLISLITGFKGPVSVVLLMAYCVYALYAIFNKKYKEGIGIGVLWLLSFLIVYCICITNIFSDIPRKNNLEFLGVVKSFDNNIWAIDNLNKLTTSFGLSDGIFTRMIALILYILQSNFSAMSLLIAGIIIQVIQLVKNKRIPIVCIALITLCIWGILLTVITHQDGNSQMYFIMATFPYCILIGLYSIDSLNLKNNKLYLAIIIIICLSLTSLKRFVFERVIPEINNGINVINGKMDEYNYRYFFTKSDYELALWLKDNTKSNDYIAIDCFEYNGLRKELGIGVLSERFIWNDGQYANDNEKDRRRNIVNEIFEGNEKSILDLKNENVQYLVQTLDVNPNFTLSNKLEIVYKNDSYIVYGVH